MTAATTVDLSKVRQVYSGKPNKCCCGCAGKHTYASAASDVAAKRNGIVSDRSVKTIVNKINALLADGSAVETCVREDFISVETETRLYVAYF
jgi:hypothetical protein